MNIISNITDSRIERRPRAPVLRSIACLAMAIRAFSLNSSSTPSIWKRRWYCLTKAFLGSVRIRTKSSWVNFSNMAITGKRPINSGIKPNFKRSSDVTCCMSDLDWSNLPLLLPKPMTLLPKRSLTMVSIPSKAPPTIKRICEVSSWMNSWLGCLRPPLGGMLAMVPSKILSKACWTPSPLTSRVMETFSLLRAILSISST